MKLTRKSILYLVLAICSMTRPAMGQFFNPSDAAVIAKLGDILRTHRQHLVEAIRTTRGIESTFRTLKNLDDYERSLRQDINFISRMDLTRLDDLERLILYGDQTDFYFRSLTSRIDRTTYDLNEMGRYGEGFLNSMDGLGVVDADLVRALYSDEKTLAEMGITPEQAAALIKELSIESTLLDMYQVRGSEGLIKALAEQSARLKEIAGDSSIKLDQGQRVMLLTKSEEALIQALKTQQELGDKLRERNEKITRKLLLKSEIEAEIAQLNEFKKWRASLERNLGFFDTEFVKRYKF